jgi:hypothetical protein
MAPEPDVDPRHPEPRSGRGQREIAGRNQFAACRGRHAFNLGDNDLRLSHHPLHQLGQSGEVLGKEFQVILAVEFAQIVPGREDPPACAGQDDHLDVAPRGQLLKFGAQRRDQIE